MNDCNEQLMQSMAMTTSICLVQKMCVVTHVIDKITL